jgi:hypothetical protein
MAACVAGQVTEASIELGCYPPLTSSWDCSQSQVDLWGPGVPKFMKSSTYEWDDMATILDLCEEVGFVEGKGPFFEAEEEVCQRILDFELLAGLSNGQDLSGFVETHNFIEDAEHAAALDRWLAGDEHGLDLVEGVTLIENSFCEESPPWNGSSREDGAEGFVNDYLQFSKEGLTIMEKMGWTGGPLGCRDSGITEPIKANGNNGTMGLGYQGEEILPPYEGEEITDSMKLTRMGANYGVGTCSRGNVFIPRGALKHMENICDQNSSRESPVGETFVCELVAGRGKHPWRLQKVLKIEMTWSAIE